MPCRIQDPDRKGKVESSIGHAQKTPLKGLQFESLEEAQAYLDRWEERWADTRIHGTTKRQVAAMFAEEKPFLLPLPVEPFRYYQYGERGRIWTVAWESKPPTTVHRRAGSGAWSGCNGMMFSFASSIPRLANCCASTCARNAAGIASSPRITPNEHRCALRNCCSERAALASTSARSAKAC